jgi:hypothetical protein
LGGLAMFRHVVLTLALLLVNYDYSFAQIKKNKNKICKPKAASLIVLNFTSSPIRVFVNNKAIGRVPKLDQIKFSKALPVGNNQVKALPRSGTNVLGSKDVVITDTGNNTCSQSTVLVVGSLS